MLLDNIYVDYYPCYDKHDQLLNPNYYYEPVYIFWIDF
jgi:hypothetical protein